MPPATIVTVRVHALSRARIVSKFISRFRQDVPTFRQYDRALPDVEFSRPFERRHGTLSPWPGIESIHDGISLNRCIVRLIERKHSSPVAGLNN
jgi:hypothetical protein